MRLLPQEILSLLYCPTTKKDLKLSDESSVPVLITADGKRSYPLVGEIPWLFKDPEYFKHYWASKKTDFLNYHKNSGLKIESELKNHKLTDATRSRLELLRKAHDLNYQSLTEILKPIVSTGLGENAVAVPQHQSLHLYRKNIFRDWGWDTDENQVGLSLIKGLVGSKWAPRTFTVLGSGASRLAMDLHSEFKLPLTVAIDFNPLLLFVGQSMLNRQNLALYDFPGAPISTSQVAELFQLSSPLPQLSGFHFIFADVADLPVRPQSFQAVLTPWLVDILPMSFNLLAQRVNQILEVGGEWINFGPLGFSHRMESQNLTIEEIREQIIECGFKIESEKVTKVNYLSAKNEVNSRNESVYLFKARKVSNVLVERFDYRADWLINLDKPIPLTEEVRQHQQLVRFQGDLFNTINGQVSVNQVAQLFSTHYKLPLGTALKMTLNVLRQFDESLKRKS